MSEIFSRTGAELGDVFKSVLFWFTVVDDALFVVLPLDCWANDEATGIVAVAMARPNTTRMESFNA